MEDRLTDKQAAFIAAYIGDAKFNATEAARQAGYKIPRASGHENLTNPAIRAEIDKHLEQVRQNGIANRAVRIAMLNDMAHDLMFIQEARARRAKERYERGDDIPEEAEGGMVVETTKVVGSGQNATVITEWSFDKGWHDSLRNTLEQAAKEAGDRDKKIEMSGPNGGPIQIESAKDKFVALIDNEESEADV